MSTSGPTLDAAKASSLLPQILAARTSGKWPDASGLVIGILKKMYPTLHLTATPVSSADLLGFACAGHATATLLDQDTKISKWTVKGAVRAPSFSLFSGSIEDDAAPPEKKKDGIELVEELEYGAYIYKWNGYEFLFFAVKGAPVGMCRPEVTNYLLSPRSKGREEHGDEVDQKAHALMRNVAGWMMQAGKSVLVFDGGQWKKDGNLWRVTQSVDWERVVLKDEVKASLRDDVEGFFDSKTLYEGFAVPWKRGIIFHGPPGNGKTLVIQNLMKELFARPEPVPTLYVKSFAAEMGPQWSVSQIFSRARATAPCLLIFEDIDSMVTEKLRSYFLNEVDGLESNNGIYMLGTTNHLDRLDPSLAQRPSRFDRKVQFDIPSRPERILYARQWRNKLSGIGGCDFPDELCESIADITDGFSFAYLKELFLATLLGMARDTMVSGQSFTTTLDTALQSGGMPGAGSFTAMERASLLPRFTAQTDVLRAAITSARALAK